MLCKSEKCYLSRVKSWGTGSLDRGRTWDGRRRGRSPMKVTSTCHPFFCCYVKQQILKCICSQPIWPKGSVWRIKFPVLSQLPIHCFSRHLGHSGAKVRGEKGCGDWPWRWISRVLPSSSSPCVYASLAKKEAEEEEEKENYLGVKWFDSDP